MTKAKQQVVEMLQEIPDDKIVHVLEMIRGLMLLYSTNSENVNTKKASSSAMGIFKKHANSSLISEEKAAWGAAVREKHVNY